MVVCGVYFLDSVLRLLCFYLTSKPIQIINCLKDLLMRNNSSITKALSGQNVKTERTCMGFSNGALTHTYGLGTSRFPKCGK